MEDRSRTPQNELGSPKPESSGRSARTIVSGAIHRFRELVQRPADKLKGRFRDRHRKTPQAGPPIEPPSASQKEPPGEWLFDGAEESFAHWQQVGSGSFDRRGDELHLAAGTDLGLLYYGARRFDDLGLHLQYRLASADAAATLAARFLDPRQPVPDREDPSLQYPYENQAYVAAHTGFEVELGVHQPGVDPGTFHGLLRGDAPGAQSHVNDASVKLDDWNDLELDLVADVYTVRINGQETARFTNLDDYRSKPASAGSNAGFIGFLIRRGAIAFRRVMVEPSSRERAPDFEGAP
jgi:hypothetical protein